MILKNHTGVLLYFMIGITAAIVVFWFIRLYLAGREIQVLTPQVLKSYLHKQRDVQIRKRTETILHQALKDKPITREMFYEAVTQAKREAEEQRQIVAQREAIEAQ